MNFRIAIILLAGLFVWQPAISEVNEKFGDMAAEMEVLRSVAQTDRQAMVVKAMPLTDQESAVFWPLYTEYRAAIDRVNDQLVQVISTFVSQRDTLSDAQADTLLNDYLAHEQELVNIRKRYVKRFGKALPMSKTIRFYQIENKLDTLQRVRMTIPIPLAK